MPIEAASETDRAIGVIPDAPWRVKGLSILPDYRLALTFQDGTCGFADLSSVISAHDCGIYAKSRQYSSAKACGYSTVRLLITVADLVAGKLTHLPACPFGSQQCAKAPA